MSYEILYDAAFIRMPNGMIPMVLAGSNNCTTTSYGANGRIYERRERSWWPFFPNSMMPYSLHSEAELQTAFDDLSKSNAGYEAFKRGGKWLMWDNMGAWFKGAAAKALPLEKWLEYNPCASFEVGFILYERTTWSAKTEHSQYIRTSQELEEWLNLVAAVEAPKYEGQYHVSVKMTFGTDEPLKSLPKAGPVVAKHSNRYVAECKKDARGFSIACSPDIAQALVFNDVEDAREKLGLYWNDCRILSAAGQMKPKNYILQLTDYYGGQPGQFLKKMTRNRIYISYNSDGVKRFASVGEARRCADGIRKRYRVGSKFFVINTESGAKEEINFANC